jgi:hypothetical protein
MLHSRRFRHSLFIAALGIALYLVLPLSDASRGGARGANASPESCAVKGQLSVTYDEQHPYRIAQLDVGANCELTQSSRELSAAEFASIAGTPEGSGSQPLTSYTNRVKGRLRAEHARIMMVQVDSYETWSWNGTSVTNYTDGYVISATGGCGWHKTDGEYAWWETGDMPYVIYIYGWAYFQSSCVPDDQGWLEPAA